jgi:hypothetical protein
MAGLYDVFFNPQVLGVIARMMGGEIRLYPNYSLRPKLPDHANSQILWHQDGGDTAQGHHVVEGPVGTLRIGNLWTPFRLGSRTAACNSFQRRICWAW